MPENEAELPSHADWYISLEDAQQKQNGSDPMTGFNFNVVGKKYIVWTRNTTQTMLFPESKSRQLRFISS
jgi:hypothetical protein